MKMKVFSEVELRVPAAEKHILAMKSMADLLTDDPNSVQVTVPEENPKSVIAEFTMPKARQTDLADRIMHAISLEMDDYNDQTVWFTPLPSTRNPHQSHDDRS